MTDLILHLASLQAVGGGHSADLLAGRGDAVAVGLGLLLDWGGLGLDLGHRVGHEQLLDLVGHLHGRGLHRLWLDLGHRGQRWGGGHGRGRGRHRGRGKAVARGRRRVVGDGGLDEGLLLRVLRKL